MHAIKGLSSSLIYIFMGKVSQKDRGNWAGTRENEWSLRARRRAQGIPTISSSLQSSASSTLLLSRGANQRTLLNRAGGVEVAFRARNIIIYITVSFPFRNKLKIKILNQHIASFNAERMILLFPFFKK